MDLPFSCDLREVKYTRQLDNLYRKVTSGIRSAFGLEYFQYDRPFDKVPFQ